MRVLSSLVISRLSIILFGLSDDLSAILNFMILHKSMFAQNKRTKLKSQDCFNKKRCSKEHCLIRWRSIRRLRVFDIRQYAYLHAPLHFAEQTMGHARLHLFQGVQAYRHHLRYHREHLGQFQRFQALQSLVV